MRPTRRAAPAAMALKTNIARGVLLMVLFALSAPMIDTFAKFAASEIPAAQITLARFLVQSLGLLPLVLILGDIRVVPREDLGLHALRGLLMATATVFFFAALKEMPIADAIAIFFVEPMILTLLGGLLLGEAVGWRRYLACAVGFMGAMLVIQPSFVELGWTAALPLATALCFALYLVLTRMLAPRCDPYSMQFLSGLSGLAAISVALLVGQGSGTVFDPVWPSNWALWMLLGVGFAATTTHLLLVFAFRHAPASVLAPFQYLEIISATLLGLIFFGDFPDLMKWIGVGVIVGSGLFIFHRERQLARQG